ncbi:MAG: DEAD/DEAH box helicase [Ignavibacteria bacterium]|nr:DEAD/DEAH box helicase [Ignavibacteria bacterium]
MKSESFTLSSQMISLLEKNGITIATPIQKEIIPAIIEGRDVLAQSETGSGKTLSFAIPIIEHINHRDGMRALVLVPTRELCMQITEEFYKFSHGKHIGIVPVYGGASINNQIRKLKSANIIVATPGRLIDLLRRRALKLDTIQYLVADEADRMLDMGFIKDLEKILQYLPQQRQTLMFSATVSKEIETLSGKYLVNPKHVRLESKVQPFFLHQTYYKTSNEKKTPLLISLLKRERELALVFCNRKRETVKLAKQLVANDIPAKCLNGDMSQQLREKVTNEFRQKKFSVLVATDVASRGLHIEDISHVYNYEIPKDVESYTHRVGRTARAGKKGDAISLVASGNEMNFFRQILFTYKGDIVLKDAGKIPIERLETTDVQPSRMKKDEVVFERKKTEEKAAPRPKKEESFSKKREERTYETRNRKKRFGSRFQREERYGAERAEHPFSRKKNEKKFSQKTNERFRKRKKREQFPLEKSNEKQFAPPREKKEKKHARFWEEQWKELLNE